MEPHENTGHVCALVSIQRKTAWTKSMCFQRDFFAYFNKTWCKFAPWILFTLSIILTVIYRYDGVSSGKIVFAERPSYKNQNGSVLNSSVFDLVPPKFLPNLKNPCWWKTPDKIQFFCLPYFYLVGMPKCGTTDLYRRLISHPHIVSNYKEPHWWTRRRYGHINGVDKSFESYLRTFSLPTDIIRRSMNRNRLFKRKNPIITVDASASTLWDNFDWELRPGNDPSKQEPDVIIAHRIHHIQPNAKFLAIFRDPVERLYSDFLYFGKGIKSSESFHQYVVQGIQEFKQCTTHRSLRSCAYNSSLITNKSPARLCVGLYNVYVKDWLSVFPKEQMLFLQLEDYHKNLRGYLETIFKFLELHPIAEEKMKNTIKQEIHNTRKPDTIKVGDMWNNTRHLLRKFYAPHNRELAQLLKDDRFLWWDN